MKKLLCKLKSNKAFTMQDLIIAFIILLLFTGVVGSGIVAIYRVQAETKLNSLATLYAIQIMENIQKISYDEVKSGDLKNWREDYGIPDRMNLTLDVAEVNNNKKRVSLTISYQFSGKTESIVLEEFKAKEY